MGMGHMANTATIISEEDLDEIVDGKVSDLKEILSTYNLSDYHLYEQIEWGDGIEISDIVSEEKEEEVRKLISRIFNRIHTLFKEKTGLDIYINYHNSSHDGSRYDDVDGVFWEVLGVYEMAENAKKLGNKLKPISYVTFG